MQTIRFRHAHFTARLPVDYRYTPSHFWLLPAPAAAGEHLPDLQGASPQAAAGRAATGQGTLWRVGFTKFATRMLGELVEKWTTLNNQAVPGRCSAGESVVDRPILRML